jgi:hypothetical protein
LKFKGLKIQILLGLGCKFDDGRDGIIPFGWVTGADFSNL